MFPSKLLSNMGGGEEINKKKENRVNYIGRPLRHIVSLNLSQNFLPDIGKTKTLGTRHIAEKLEDSKETHQNDKKLETQRKSLISLSSITEKTYIKSIFQKEKKFCVCVKPKTCSACHGIG